MDVVKEKGELERHAGASRRSAQLLPNLCKALVSKTVHDYNINRCNQKEDIDGANEKKLCTEYMLVFLQH